MNSKLSLNRILWTIYIAQFLVMQIWFNFSAVLTPVKLEWGLSNFQAGMILSVFQLGYVVAVFFFSFLSDSHSPQKILLIGSLTTSLASLMFAYCAIGFYSGLFFRALAGIGMGGAFVPGMRLLTGLFPAEKRGKAIGIYVSFTVIGSGASLLLSGILVKLLNWQMLIALTSAGGLLGSYLVYRLGNIPVKTVKYTLSWQLIKRVIRRPSMSLNLAYMGHLWELHGMWPWIGPFMVAVYLMHGYAFEDAQMYGNIVGGLSIILGFTATWLGGAISDEKGRIKTIMVFLLGSIFCSFTIGWTGSWSLWVAGILAILYGFLIIGDGPIYSTGITELVDEEYAGLALGIQSVMGFGVTIISPSVLGLLLDATHSWGIAFASLGLGALIGLVSLLALKKMPESYQMAGGKQ